MLPNIKDPSGVKFSTFNPLTAPGNVAIYDGDVNLSAASWRDNAGGNQITFFNAPTYNAAGLNGHGTILFDGINQYGLNNTIALIQNYTIYLVVNRIANGVSKRIWNANDTFLGLRTTTTLNLQLNAGSVITTEPDLPLNTFDILTMVMNTTHSKIRTNLNIPVEGDVGIQNGLGLNLGCSEFISLFANCSIAYIIIRNVVDPTWLENNFINWLKNRFAL